MTTPKFSALGLYEAWGFQEDFKFIVILHANENNKEDDDDEEGNDTYISV